jgi:acetylornithine deacetylase/succinyl-diaminopimelate desuccinylase-like protein
LWDAKHFERAGIQTYGFTPMNLPEEFVCSEIIHAADERIPVEAVDFGTNAVYTALQLYHKV